MFPSLTFIVFIIHYFQVSGGWKAIPANKALYSLRIPTIELPYEESLFYHQQPRDFINHIYKFGYCTPDVIRRQYLRSSVNVTLATPHASRLNYIYVLVKKHTINYRMQCIVMTSYVPARYMLYRSRLPLYYCQGVVFIMMMSTVNRYEIHEFYFQGSLSMPLSFTMEFYHPTPM